MHIVCKKLIGTLNIIFVQVYPCDKHLQSQKLEWKRFVHFSVKEFLYNISLSLLFDSVLRSVIPFPHSRFNILRLPSSPLKCTLVYRKFFSVKFKQLSPQSITLSSLIFTKKRPCMYKPPKWKANRQRRMFKRARDSKFNVKTRHACS